MRKPRRTLLQVTEPEGFFVAPGDGLKGEGINPMQFCASKRKRRQVAAKAAFVNFLYLNINKL